MLLERLYALDHRRDSTWDAMRALKRDVAESDAKVQLADQELAELRRATQAVVADERTRNVRLEKYLARRDRTQAQLDQGLIPDFLSAERQVQNYGEIIDEIELELLDLMERHEHLDHKHMAVADRRRRSASRLDQQRQRVVTEGGQLEQELSRLNAQRKGHKAAVPQYIVVDYELLRTLHRDALAHLAGGCCDACRMQHPPQVVLEVARGQRMHRCRGCTRYLVGVVDVDPAGTDVDVQAATDDARDP